MDRVQAELPGTRGKNVRRIAPELNVLFGGAAAEAALAAKKRERKASKRFPCETINTSEVQHQVVPMHDFVPGSDSENGQNIGSALPHNSGEVGMAVINEALCE